MPGLWTLKQYGDEVYRFRDRECSADVWDEIVISLAILREKGPVGAGTRIAKRLGGGDGIWELIAHFDNLQPRLLFYERPRPFSATIAFVYPFMKKGKQNYGPAIKIAKQRRSAVERRGGGGDTLLGGIVLATRIH